MPVPMLSGHGHAPVAHHYEALAFSKPMQSIRSSDNLLRHMLYRNTDTRFMFEIVRMKRKRERKFVGKNDKIAMGMGV